MAKFKKKPVIIEAIQFKDLQSVDSMLLDPAFEGFEKASTYDDKTNNLTIHTLEGDHHANVGDYIIKGVKGEFYPCKPDIFALTYEPVK